MPATMYTDRATGQNPIGQIYINQIETIIAVMLLLYRHIVVPRLQHRRLVVLDVTILSVPQVQLWVYGILHSTTQELAPEVCGRPAPSVEEWIR